MYYCIVCFFKLVFGQLDPDVVHFPNLLSWSQTLLAQSGACVVKPYAFVNFSPSQCCSPMTDIPVVADEKSFSSTADCREPHFKHIHANRGIK